MKPQGGEGEIMDNRIPKTSSDTKITEEISDLKAGDPFEKDGGLSYR